MRTILKNLFAALFLVAAFTSQAQVSLGLKAGLMYSNVSVNGVGDLVPSTKIINGYSVGAVAEIPLLNGFAFQPELTYTTKGFRVKEGLDLNLFNLPLPVGVEAHTRVQYVEIPLLGKYNFGTDVVGGYVIGGPYAGFATKARLETKANFIIDFNVYETDINLKNDNFQRFEAGLMGGAGVWAKAGNGKIFLDARYQHGLSDLFNDPIVDLQMKNRNIGINAGYMMSF